MIERLSFYFVAIACLFCCSCTKQEGASPRQSSGQGDQPVAGVMAQHEPFEALFGSVLINRGREACGTAVLEGKVVGIYFSAHWCPPCHYFTPKLINFYEELKKIGQPFEVVLVSRDRSASDMQIYMDEMQMPWLAIPFGERGVRERLKQAFDVRGIPTLIILNNKGGVLTTEGVNDVVRKGVKAYREW